MILLSAQGMPAVRIAEVTFTSTDRVRDVIHKFNADGFDSLYPRYAGGRPRKFTLPERREIKKIAKSRPSEHGLPFSTWSLSKLAEFLVAEGVADDISHEGLRVLLREEGVSFQRMKTWRASTDPEDEAKKARVEHLYAIADGQVTPDADEPTVVFCVDGFGPLNLQPRPGRMWAGVGGARKDPKQGPRRRRATYTRRQGARRLLAAYDLARDRLYGHVKVTKNRTSFLAFCRYLRSLHPPTVRIAIICDNFSPYLTTRKDRRVGDRAPAANVEIAYTPHLLQLTVMTPPPQKIESPDTPGGFTGLEKPGWEACRGKIHRDCTRLWMRRGVSMSTAAASLISDFYTHWGAARQRRRWARNRWPGGAPQGVVVADLARRSSLRSALIRPTISIEGRFTLVAHDAE